MTEYLAIRLAENLADEAEWVALDETGALRGPVNQGNLSEAAEQAIDLMERQVDNHSWTYLWIRTLFRNEPAVKDHPRYLALLKRIRLDDESVAALQQKLPFDEVMEKGNKDMP